MQTRGVVVGSTDTNFWEIFPDSRAIYCLGLWCADGYHRTSSIGLCNVDKHLLALFRDFLLTIFPIERLRLRVYLPSNFSQTTAKEISNGLQIKHLSICKLKKGKVPTIHLYVNNRPLLRLFIRSRQRIDQLPKKHIWPYLAGRFDGDGSISIDEKSDCRIVYTKNAEANIDKMLLEKAGISGVSIYYYKHANTYCLYISRKEAKSFVKNIRDYSRSQKLVSVPSRDLVH